MRPGDTIQYSIIVTNTGDATLEDVHLQFVTTSDIQIVQGQTSQWQSTDTSDISTLILESLAPGQEVVIPTEFIVSSNLVAISIERAPILRVFYQETPIVEVPMDKLPQLVPEQAPTRLNDSQEPSVKRLFLPLIVR